MKRKLLSTIIGVLSISCLAGCGGSGDATIRNASEGSAHGHVEGLKESYKAGETATFTVIPDDYFDVGKVTFNSKTLSAAEKTDEGYVYSVKVESGENKLITDFDVDPTVDIGEKFKLDVSDEVFDYIIGFDQSDTKDNKPTLDAPDFRRDGIEQFRAPLKYDKTKKQYVGKADDSDFFFNCVDGDTTHMETFNLKYTVKIRYLMVDTQESTSQMEEWGLSGSYFSKYTFWGSFGKENNKEAHYEQKIAQLFSAEEVKKLVGGSTHIILLSKPMARAGVSATLEEIQASAGQDPEYKGKYGSTTDGNQRDLAFVWYAKTDKDKPEKEDFRCLNLDLIYYGFSENTGSADAYGDYYFKYFDAAGLSARANGRHMHSGERDPFYYYYDDPDVVVPTLPIYKIYQDAPSDPTIGYIPESSRCDKMRLWAIEGYVSRKVGSAFYIQDKPSYTEAEIERIKKGDKSRTFGYGVYVFTYAQTPIDEGHHVRVIGALSSYGGTFQVQGISYTAYNPNPKRNTTILDDERVYDMVPIKLSVKEFHSAQLPQLLVQLTDNVYFNQFTIDETKYGGGFEDVCEGGSREVNRYNQDYYKFYNTSNALTLFARYGDVDDSEEVKESEHTGDNFRKTDKFLRVVVDQEVLVEYRGEIGYSYKFFTGGELDYNSKGPKYIGEEGTTHTEYNRKVCLTKEYDDGSVGGIIGISKGYISTSYKTFKMEIAVVNAFDIQQFIKIAK